jgi:hypothetical protein
MAAEGAELATAAEAGPAAPIVLAAEEIQKKIIGAIDFVGDAATKIGSVTAKLASNDNFGAIAEVSHTVADGLKKLGPLGEIAGHTVEAFTKVAEAVNQVTQAFIQRGRELAQYSPALAEAGAKADVRALMADIQEANTLGPELARLTEAESKASADLREMLLPLKNWVIKNLADFIEWIVPHLKEMYANGQRILVVLELLWNLTLDVTPGTNKHFSDIAGDINHMRDELKEINDGLNKKDEAAFNIDDIMKELLNQDMNLPLPLPANMPVPNRNGPFFGGGAGGGLPGGLAGGF